MDEKEYIEERLKDQMDWYDRKSVKSQKIYKWFKVAEICIAVSIPFWVVVMELVEEESCWPVLFKVMIAFSGVAIAVLTGLHGIYKFQENWMAYRTTCEMLIHEKVFYETGCGPYKEAKDKLCLLVHRVEELISQENTNWRKYMKAQVNEQENDS